ncbi:MAG: hypothetical protein J6R86_07040 [Lentisphaeria bacterium]|nr:hypothetical protein [Lentisphaeria bacterium]
MKYFDFSCPFCQQKFSAASELEGESFKCPTCERNFVIKSTKESRDCGVDVKKSCMNNADVKNNADSLVAETMSEQINQLKTEIILQAEFSNTTVHELKKINRLLTCFFGLSIVITLFILFIQVPAFQRNIEHQVNNLAKNIPGQITDKRIISYTWEEYGEMKDKVRNALEDGYEPAGFMCNNRLKGGLFLFVKRKKN